MSHNDTDNTSKDHPLYKALVDVILSIFLKLILVSYHLNPYVYYTIEPIK
ncbi:hypothetical protein RGT18_12500 [Solobacterium moorei]|nr:hypothetical protein RGT18_12500 [Solobacterium moorei]